MNLVDLRRAVWLGAVLSLAAFFWPTRLHPGLQANGVPENPMFSVDDGRQAAAVSRVRARGPRVQYPGAIYHVINRGDPREAIFWDDQDQRRFVETLGEVCQKARPPRQRSQWMDW
jgi:hypothetical protein